MTKKLKKKDLKSKFPHVVVVVEGGLVQTYVADQPVNLMVVDIDNEKAGDDPRDRSFDLVDVDPDGVMGFVNCEDDWTKKDLPDSDREVLERAEGFILGFEDDENQEGIPELLKDLRRLIEKS